MNFPLVELFNISSLNTFVKEIFGAKVPVPSEMYDDFEELIKPLQEEHEKKLEKQNND